MSSHKPGFQSALETIKGLSPDERERLLENMAKQDPELVAELRASLFHFNDLVDLSGDQIRGLIDQVSDQDWALAFRNASDEVKEYVYAQMTKRRAETLRDLVDELGPQPLSKVQEAQAKIASQADKK
jgi:flagellar motor switch protein FliG